MNKIDKTLARLTKKKKREGSDKSWNWRGEITLDTKQNLKRSTKAEKIVKILKVLLPTLPSPKCFPAFKENMILMIFILFGAYRKTRGFQIYTMKLT